MTVADRQGDRINALVAVLMGHIVAAIALAVTEIPEIGQCVAIRI